MTEKGGRGFKVGVIDRPCRSSIRGEDSSGAEIEESTGDGHCSLARPPTLVREPVGTMAFRKRWLAVVVYVVSIYLAEVALSAFEVSHSGPSNQRIFGGPVATAVVAVSLLVSLGILGFALGTALKGWPKTNVLVFVTAALLFTPLVSSIPDMLERVHLMLYFPLGILLYRAHMRRPLSLRVCLDAVCLFYGVVFVDNIVQGVLPNRMYSLEGGKNLGFVAMPFLGVLFSRALDLEKPMDFSRKRRTARTYLGRKPLLDLHFYERDLLYAGIVIGLLAANNLIESWLSNDDLVGQWRPVTGRDSCVVLRKDGTVRCKSSDGTRKVGVFHVSGNLFDGFRLAIYRDARWKGEGCPYLASWPNPGRRFRIEGNAMEFDDIAKDWRWVVETIRGKLIPGQPPSPGRAPGREIWERLPCG